MSDQDLKQVHTETKLALELTEVRLKLEKAKGALMLLGDHHRECPCNCMDHQGIAKQTLADLGEK